MLSPFPGMDPYLEDPTLWPDVHLSFIAVMAESGSMESREGRFFIWWLCISSRVIDL